MLRGDIQAGEMSAVLSLAVERSVTAYDAAYVVLALERGVRCITEDAALRKAFPETAVSMSAFLSSGPSSGTVNETPGRYRVRRR